MKKYLIEWETDYCDNFPEVSGECVIEAATRTEAINKFYKSRLTKAVVTGIREVN